ncbi:hypothetical protein [Algivirga pacifica]|uniref:CcoQ/FixQ family Cbb3-type cytochrome c oxidase assembly chaperone n=1 Tax=Algivirga pacifica TaxID=1162670 RepID=A0ABP9D7V1_9BACT
MYKDVLRSIDGIEIFPVIGIAIFFLFFVAWIIYVTTMKKQDVDTYSAIPLDLDLDDKIKANDESNI